MDPTWSELLGSNNWDGLLDPLSLPLRRFILLSGDLCQATYDAFNNDQNSPYCGCSRYGKSSFFQKVMFDYAAENYVVSSFLYATALVGAHEAFLFHSLSRESWDRESNWIGYVAVSNDDFSRSTGRREIYVAWRGTSRDYEWVNVLGAKLESTQPLLTSPQKIKDFGLKKRGGASNDSSSSYEWVNVLRAKLESTHSLLNSPKKIKDFGLEKRGGASNDSSSSSSDDDDDEEKVPKVMQGWLTMYTAEDPKSPYTRLSARTQLQNKIKELINRYRDEKLSIVLTGHSLGASLSVVAGFDLVENGINDIPIAAIVFGCPQVGNRAFNERIKRYPNFKILHVRNKIDTIPLYPSHLLGYVDSGVKLEIDTRKSPYLKDSRHVGDWHNLQAMLHVVNGWNGENGEFELKLKRSLSFVNKSCDFLKDECLVPGSWWVEKNKGMVLSEDGEWVLAKPADEDLPALEY